MSYFILVLFLNVLFFDEFLSNIFWLWAKILWLRSLKAFPHFFLHSSHRYFFDFFLRCFSVSWIIRPTLVQLLKLHLIHLKFLPENKQKKCKQTSEKNSKQTTYLGRIFFDVWKVLPLIQRQNHNFGKDETFSLSPYVFWFDETKAQLVRNFWIYKIHIHTISFLFLRERFVCDSIRQIRNGIPKTKISKVYVCSMWISFG